MRRPELFFKSSALFSGWGVTNCRREVPQYRANTGASEVNTEYKCNDFNSADEVGYCFVYCTYTIYEFCVCVLGGALQFSLIMP